jgi:hypothetical protein
VSEKAAKLEALRSNLPQAVRAKAPQKLSLKIQTLKPLNVGRVTAIYFDTET